VSRFVLSPAAQADLSDIWDYSVKNWGRVQAERYVLGIRDACQALADGSRTGRAVDAIRRGYRRLAVGSHLLFYRVGPAGVIEVVRILHRRMDIAAHLRDP
jgi:toxin ParE1/3/4